MLRVKPGIDQLLAMLIGARGDGASEARRRLSEVKSRCQKRLAIFLSDSCQHELDTERDSRHNHTTHRNMNSLLIPINTSCKHGSRRFQCCSKD
jgi:hypothetical protein